MGWASSLSPPDWSFFAHNVPATPSTTIGTLLASGSNNADGAAATLLSALAQDVFLLEIGIAGFASAGNDVSVLMDLLIDPAGGTTWQALINDLIIGHTWGVTTTAGLPLYYVIPIRIPAGASVGARARSSHTVNVNGRVQIKALGGNKGSFWSGSAVASIGTNPASSKGTAHLPGNSGAMSSWADLGSPLASHANAFLFGVGGSSNAESALTYNFELGVAGVAISPPIIRLTNANEAGAVIKAMPSMRSFPAGTQLQVRGSCSGVAESHDLAAYAIS